MGEVDVVRVEDRVRALLLYIHKDSGLAQGADAGRRQM